MPPKFFPDLHNLHTTFSFSTFSILLRIRFSIRVCERNMSGGLSWRHHVVIQALLSRGPLKEKDLHSIFEDLTKKNPGTDRQLFNGFILKINKALACANFELRGCIDQYDGQVYYGVVNTVADEHSKLGTKYTVPQIAFYKAIIEAIVQNANANGFISSIDALNLNLDSQVTIVTDPQSQGSQPNVPSALKHFTLSQKEKALNELVRDQWLNLTENGIIKLGPKSFLDLRGWFRHNDVPSCHVCSEAGIKAELCQNENCTVRIHQYCLKQLFSQRKVAKICPSCSTLWPYTVPKVEAIQTEDDNEHRGSQRATGSQRKRHSANRVADEEVGCSNQDEMNKGTGSQQSNGLAPKRGKACRNDADKGGSGASQSSSAISDFRRVTRSSARLR
ncbi:non-structural maintenance of chromosomes element 1 homolog [Abrus precatorius]|uniref:Non-structural maintenance of chromosomes element 1 homolog n=1 Tax=Abrus precatorius TaxID=3816 RepID=A0A8B8KRE9_ABRPR|nr:non-structural maintenance of chromosomes element 1 homolog [Abrus precatorius]